MCIQGSARPRGVAAGIVFGAVAVAALVQQRQFQRRQDMTAKHRLHFDLLCKAMCDPALAAVLDTYDADVPPERQRQFLFANALYGNILHAYRTGTMDLEEALGHLRGACQSSVFRDFWDHTGHHRESLPSDSQESRLGRLVDDIVARASEQNDGWWVA